MISLSSPEPANLLIFSHSSLLPIPSVKAHFHFISDPILAAQLLILQCPSQTLRYQTNDQEEMPHRHRARSSRRCPHTSLVTKDVRPRIHGAWILGTEILRILTLGFLTVLVLVAPALTSSTALDLRPTALDDITEVAAYSRDLLIALYQFQRVLSLAKR